MENTDEILKEQKKTNTWLMAIYVLMVAYWIGEIVSKV